MKAFGVIAYLLVYGYGHGFEVRRLKLNSEIIVYGYGHGFEDRYEFKDNQKLSINKLF